MKMKCKNVLRTQKIRFGENLGEGGERKIRFGENLGEGGEERWLLGRRPIEDRGASKNHMQHTVKRLA